MVPSYAPKSSTILRDIFFPSTVAIEQVPTKRHLEINNEINKIAPDRIGLSTLKELEFMEQVTFMTIGRLALQWKPSV